MERRIQQKINDYLADFKESIKNNFNELIRDNHNLQDNIHELQIKHIQNIYNFPTLQLTEEDFRKRKRIKNNIPLEDRCCAFRANKQQCSRRKLQKHNFCGTHLKGQPHGSIDNQDIDTTQTISIWAEDIKGIHYYIDNNGRVYDNNDVLTNKINPKVIAMYTVEVDTDGKNVYSIPEFGI